jgi:hypothetical protein
LEVIAEHACGTVTDACALRRCCPVWRRAVDTTVRRRVYEDQPELRGGSGSCGAAGGRRASDRAMLVLHFDTAHLISARIAFTRDTFAAIVRLVVVAFALDGAKDDLHEGAVCGQRPVAGSFAADADLRVRSYTSHLGFEPWRCASEIPTPSCRAALGRCLTDAVVSGDTLTEALCLDAEGAVASGVEQADSNGVSHGDWAFVTRLQYVSAIYTLPRPHMMSRLLLAIGPQLTHVSFAQLSAAMCRGLAACTSLAHIRVSALDSASGDVAYPSVAAAMCDALIASGAPLESVHIGEHETGYDAADLARLVDAVPTITEVAASKVHMGDVSPAALQRLATFNDFAHALPSLRCVRQVDQPSTIADFEAAYPRLQSLHIGSFADGIAIETVRFPRTLTSVSLAQDASDAFAAALLERLGADGRLALARVQLSSLCVSLEPLAVFADTLTTLSFTEELDGATLADAELQRVEAVLERLVALERLAMMNLPTARCLLGGRHTRLHTLQVHAIDVPGGATLDAVVQACPRLVQVTCVARALGLPDGWAAFSPQFSPVMHVTRSSFFFGAGGW